jgi:hypothetical protein
MHRLSSRRRFELAPGGEKKVKAGAFASSRYASGCKTALSHRRVRFLLGMEGCVVVM